MNTRTETSNVALAATASGNAMPAYAPVPEWCRISGMGRSKTYEGLGVGDLRAIKVGARTLIDVSHGLAWLKSLPPAVIRPHGNKKAKPAN